MKYTVKSTWRKQWNVMFFFKQLVFYFICNKNFWATASNRAHSTYLRIANLAILNHFTISHSKSQSDYLTKPRKFTHPSIASNNQYLLNQPYQQTTQFYSTELRNSQCVYTQQNLATANLDLPNQTYSLTWFYFTNHYSAMTNALIIWALP